MVVGNVAHLVPHDVGIHIFVGEEGITEERERTLFTTSKHCRAATHLTLGRTDDEHHKFPSLEEKKECHHADTY